jgi:hypothetical protein
MQLLVGESRLGILIEALQIRMGGSRVEIIEQLLHVFAIAAPIP